MVEHNFLDLDASPGSGEGVPVPVASNTLMAVRDFCTTWVRAVKTICLYPASNSLPDEFRNKFFLAITSILESEGPIDLTTSDGGFSYQSETVFEEEGSVENIACALFQDGIRRITFQPGVSREESDQFLALLAEATVAGTTHVDIANLMWEAGFDHIRHYTVDRVVEGIYVEPADDTTLNSIHHRFIDSGAAPAPAGEEEQPEGEDDSPYAGEQKERFQYFLSVFGNVDQLSPGEKNDIAVMIQPLADDETERLGMEILFEIGRGADNPRIADDTVRVMERQYQHFVDADRWHLAQCLLQEWRGSLETASPRIIQHLQGAISRASSPKTFECLTAYLNSHPQAKLDSVSRLLPLFGPTAITPVTAMLGTLEHRPARIVICEFLSAHGRETIDLIGGFIYDKRWYVVRNVAMILGEIGHERALVFLQKSAKHDDHRVRLETLRSVQQYRSKEAERIVRGFIHDRDTDLRRRALRTLSHSGSGASLAEIEKLVSQSSLPDKDPQELRELFTAYAHIGGEKAADSLIRIATRTHWFGSGRWQPIKIAAVTALGASQTARARAELGILARKRNSALAQAARNALEHRNRQESEYEDNWTKSDPGGTD